VTGALTCCDLCERKEQCIGRCSFSFEPSITQEALPDKTIHILLPVEPTTKKNSSNIVTNWKKKQRFVVPSKKYSKYENECGKYLNPLGIDYPINVKAIYYRKTRGTVDLINLHAALHDMLVKHKVIKDDNIRVIVSTDGSRVRYDKEDPRAEIWIEPITSEVDLEERRRMIPPEKKTKAKTKSNTKAKPKG
jgi:Holliday junction resolvase RusA-like endonuclease